jgi:DeoR/GlpR family transcriptional regulator of sugar metabolism
MTFHSQDRRERILARVSENGHVTVRDLAAEIAVSEATVRRDLKSLADENLVQLVYGGAARLRTSDYSFRAKARRNYEEKQIIGRLASELVGDDEQIFLDSGTTCFEMAPLLARKRGLTIIVNSARLVMELPEAPGITVFTLGGRYRADRQDTVGPLATATLDQLRGYVAFIGADGLSMDFGLTASDMESAFLYRQAVRNARQTCLLVDHSKFQTPSLFKIVDWDAISRVITDRPPTPEWAEFLAFRNIQCICPPEPSLAATAPQGSPEPRNDTDTA